MREDYKEIYLEGTSHPIAITPQAYEQIVAIIKANLICAYCLKGYTQENPQVAENVCKACFLKHRTNTPTNLIFVSEVPSEWAERYGYTIYKFVDPQGYVYQTDSHRKLNDTIERNIRATLLHYGYKVPEHYTLKGGKEVDLNTFSWSAIYGDFKTSPVVMATYHENYGDHIDTAFLLYRNRDPVEFTRRKKQMRDWYDEAKAEIEATYKPHQGYIVGKDPDGELLTVYQLYDHHMYLGIVARACEAYGKEEASTLFSS